MNVHDDISEVEAIVASARAAQARYEAGGSQERYDRAAQPADKRQDDRPCQGQPQRPHAVPPSCAGRVRQWLGTVQAASAGAARHRLPLPTIVRLRSNQGPLHVAKAA